MFLVSNNESGWSGFGNKFDIFTANFKIFTVLIDVFFSAWPLGIIIASEKGRNIENLHFWLFTKCCKILIL